jgi:hypothetical protein
MMDSHRHPLACARTVHQEHAPAVMTADRIWAAAVAVHRNSAAGEALAQPPVR